ncbi:CDP-glycerol glycerophosphotransferase family protein [Microbacterium sp. NIBRBAC000506063]|uniref:CDP-glycerol glycerophosphotransferase family protein n=1 Tax=Microbacterium sp. NIBRBAC000506063 TaxID=2734618 RepID=UPI002948B8FC|nr:CDP-glycerol glycerophosphotransferase family protein [Microbacterium sp. NIBRBAC000506063]
MGFVSDARKGYRLLKRAVAARASAQRIRQRFADQEPHAPGRFRIAVYFADSSVNMYQIRQWYRPLQELSHTHEVVVLARSAVGAEALLDDGELPVVHLPTIRDLEAYIATQDIRIVLYVNQNTRNFQMFRYGHRWHVFINHGESDKVYMVSNQFRSYDYAFIAGEAARARLSKALWNYDVDTRTIQIGRPQADHFSATVPYPDDDRTVVLYAPTWEGDRASMSYGSIRTHGTELVRQVLASPGHRLIYRPHPRSGVIDPEYGAANKDIIRAIAEANAADPSAHHVYDDGPEVGWQLAAADVAVLDISAMIYDRLATGRPLMVTRPPIRRPRSTRPAICRCANGSRRRPRATPSRRSSACGRMPRPPSGSRPGRSTTSATRRRASRRRSSMRRSNSSWPNGTSGTRSCPPSSSIRTTTPRRPRRSPTCRSWSCRHPPPLSHPPQTCSASSRRFARARRMCCTTLNVTAIARIT